MKVSCNGLLRCSSVQFGGIQVRGATTVLHGIFNKRYAPENEGRKYTCSLP
jgi:hypothetical protein